MKININAVDKVQAELDRVQNRCKTRTIMAADITKILNKIGVPKSKLSGTKIHWDGAEKFPSAYKYTPKSTHWEAENINGRWYVTDIYRSTCPNRSTFKGEIEYSDSAKEWIIKNASMITT